MSSNLEALIEIPFAWYRQMRQTNPIAYDQQRKMWSIFRYSDALHILTHPEIFSSEPQTSYQPHLPSILGMDPPRHHQLRSIVSQAFTPRVVAQLEPRITAITNRLLDQAIEQGEMDVVQDLAYPLPITIIAELLGIPVQEQATFRQWSNNITTGPRYDGVVVRPELRIESNKALEAYFLQKLAERRRQPREDLMSKLITAEVDGKHLSDDELVEFCRLLLIAGHETTANLIGNAMVCFDEHPEAAEELRQNPSLMSGAVEEILRCYPSVAGAVRTTLVETTLGTHQIAKNQTIAIFVTSANYDEQQFPEAERFDIRREPNRHLSFGHGIHFCLGAPLARLEARIALNLMLERFSEMKRITDRPIEAVKSPFILGVRHFPLTFKVKS